ncbi:hypothetical protein [uncultured Capnocytophaga sp.]|uniref:hypothetical protein n=1 Tax=uncultured Capnocytophaga sp. TaxID=159273 RepID=UPI00261CA8FB|nr:hypothetical protein [uncultured Capnocytophaga sp.]
MNNQIDISSYGILILSVEQFSSFLKEEKKTRVKKVLQLLQKELSLYKRSIQTGSWLPIPGIDSISYEIKITNLGDSFNEEWEEKYTYSSFNLSVGEDNSIWIGSIGLLFDWNKDEYVGDAMTYYTLDGIQLTKALKFPLEKGKYLVTIQRYKRKSEQKSIDSNSGFLFSFTKVETFESTNDPREDRYAFNQVNK